ncbi:MAG: GNAT family N-acetyltransferase [Candidatus Taylorbacteria bacterium]|nr:GNAT family N-acetyltransferase [Candidatus Taylorbacteria bacterium]
MLKIVTLRKDYSKLEDQIVNFYAPKYQHPFTKETVKNSALICLAFEDDKIVGGIRAVSDLTRHALIVDLIVDKSYRKNKIGTKLLLALLKELKKCKVKNIGLTTEPGVDWLVDFYHKHGFKPLKGSVYLELED